MERFAACLLRLNYPGNRALCDGLDATPSELWPHMLSDLGMFAFLILCTGVAVEVLSWLHDQINWSDEHRSKWILRYQARILTYLFWPLLAGLLLSMLVWLGRSCC